MRQILFQEVFCLQEVGGKLLIGFSHNQMKLNSDKFDLLLNTQKQNITKTGNYGKNERKMETMTSSYIMFQIDQTYFSNPTVFAADHFGAVCIKSTLMQI